MDDRYSIQQSHHCIMPPFSSTINGFLSILVKDRTKVSYYPVPSYTIELRNYLICCIQTYTTLLQNFYYCIDLTIFADCVQ
jgi:hypothetical protein